MSSLWWSFSVIPSVVVVWAIYAISPPTSSVESWLAIPASVILWAIHHLGVALWILWQLTPSPPSVIDNQTFTRIHRWSSCELVDFPVVVQPLSQCGLSDRGGNAFFGAIIVEVAILAQVEQSLRSQRSFAPTRPKHSHCLGWVVAYPAGG